MQIKTTLGFDLTTVRIVTKLGKRQPTLANMGRWEEPLYSVCGEKPHTYIHKLVWSLGQSEKGPLKVKINYTIVGILMKESKWICNRYLHTPVYYRNRHSN